MVVEVEPVAALDAEELAVNSGMVAVVAADDFAVANAERGLAAVGAMRADGANVLHLPRARLIAISAGGQRADRTNVDASAALVALQVVTVRRSDLRNHAAVDYPQRPDAQPLIAHPHAAVAKDAA